MVSLKWYKVVIMLVDGGQAVQACVGTGMWCGYKPMGWLCWETDVGYCPDPGRTFERLPMWSVSLSREDI